MGGGSAPKETTTTVKNETPAWLEAPAKQALGTGWNLSQLPYNPYPGLSLAPLSPQQQAAMYMGTQLGTQGGAEMNAGGRLLTDTLGGGYLTNNPYLEQQIRLAQQEVMPDIGYQAMSSGSFGNSGLNEAAAQQYGDIAQNMRFANYSQERQNQMQALNLAPQYQQQRWDDVTKLMGMGDAARAYQQELIDQSTNRWETAQQWPYQQLDWFTNILRGAGYGSGAGTSTTTAPNPYQSNALANFIGGGMALGGLYDIMSS